MTSTFEHPAEEEKETVPVATPESPVGVVHEMTREGIEGGISTVHETAQNAVDELEGMIKDLTGAREQTPEKKPEDKKF